MHLVLQIKHMLWILDLTLDEVDKLTKYKNAVLVFMSSKDIYVLEDKYKELVNKD